MKLTATDEQALDALVSQHAESRSPVQTMIVQAACNARTSTDRDRIRASLSRLKAAGFVARTASDRWIPTKSGIARATGVQAGTEEDAMRNAKTEAAPSEGSATTEVVDSASTEPQLAEETVTIRVVNASEGMVSMEVPADSPAATSHRKSQPRPEPVLNDVYEKGGPESSEEEETELTMGGFLGEHGIRQPGSIRYVASSDECLVNPGYFAEKPRSKYHREIKPGVWVDIYDVLVAWAVQNPALQHLIKKALAPGQRGHKDLSTDLDEIIASAKRARELCK